MSQGQPGYNPNADLNCDNTVDITDLGLLADNYFKTGDVYAAALRAVSTGSGKITLYWEGSSGATGYNVYRGNAAGTEDYAHPVNPSPVTTLSYAGGTVYIYTDTGLTNGNQYFYTVKALNSAGMSVASNESSDVVDSEAVPWDTRNPAQILQALTNLSPEPIGEVFRVMGPDGSIYESGNANPLLPDAVPSDTVNAWDFKDGTVLPALEWGGQSGNPPATTGPVRRVISQPGYIKCQSGVTLPEEIVVQAYQYPSNIMRWNNELNKFVNYNTGDVPHIYMGSRSPGTEIDAGLLYQPLKNEPNHSVWKPFINVNKNYAYAQPGHINMDGTSAQFYCEAGDMVDMTYYFQRPTQVDLATGKKETRNVFIRIVSLTGLGLGVSVTYSAVASKLPANATNVRLKRLNTIAQVLAPETGDAATGFRATGSYCQYAEWMNVRLFTSSTSVLWNSTSTITYENLKWPAGRVSSTYIGTQLYNEFDVSINLIDV
jgi:hypothetical protein